MDSEFSPAVEPLVQAFVQKFGYDSADEIDVRFDLKDMIDAAVAEVLPQAKALLRSHPI